MFSSPQCRLARSHPIGSRIISSGHFRMKRTDGFCVRVVLVSSLVCALGLALNGKLVGVQQYNADFGLPFIAIAPRQTYAERCRATRRCRLEAGTGEVSASASVDELGLKFMSLPPGRVIVKMVVPGSWAETQGFEPGSEVRTVNNRVVSNLTATEFRTVMRERPVYLSVSFDPRELQRELTYTSSAAAVLRLILPWVDGLHFDTIHMQTAIYRLGVHSQDFNAEIAASPVFEKLVGLVHIALLGFAIEERGLSNIMWAMAKLEGKTHHFSQLFPALVDAIVEKRSSFSQRCLSNILYSVATLRREVPDLKQLASTILAAVSNHDSTMDAQQVANNFWAVAGLRDQAPVVRELVPLLVETAIEQAPRMVPQAIAAVMWAAGVLRLSDARSKLMYEALCPELTAKIGGFDPHGLSIASWGLSWSSVRNSSFMLDMSSCFQQRAKSLFGRKAAFSFTQILCAHARLKIQDQTLMDLTATRLSSEIAKLPDWNVCALLWSYDQLDRRRRHAGFVQLLDAERTRRNLLQSDVSRAAFGPEEWYTDDAAE